LKRATFRHLLPSSPKFQSRRSCAFYDEPPSPWMCPDTKRAPSPAVLVLWRGRSTGHPHWPHGKSDRKPKARRQSRWAGRQRRKPWGSGERVDQRGGRQEQRKPKSISGKCQGRFCFDGSCHWSASFCLWLPPPTFPLPQVTCRGLGGKCQEAPRCQQLRCSMVVASSCLRACVLTAQDYPMPCKTPHPVKAQN